MVCVGVELRFGWVDGGIYLFGFMLFWKFPGLGFLVHPIGVRVLLFDLWFFVYFFFLLRHP